MQPEGRADILNIREERGAKLSQEEWCEQGKLWQTNTSDVNLETLP